MSASINSNAGAGAAAARNFQEHASRVPVLETGESNPPAFLWVNAPVRCQMHTSPFRLLNLAESCTDYNHGGLAILRFGAGPNDPLRTALRERWNLIGAIPTRKRYRGDFNGRPSCFRQPPFRDMG